MAIGIFDTSSGCTASVDEAIARGWGNEVERGSRHNDGLEQIQLRIVH